MTEKELKKFKIEDEVTDVVCEECGRNMVIKYLPRLIIQFMDEKNVRVTIDDIHLVIPLPENSNRG